MTVNDEWGDRNLSRVSVVILSHNRLEDLKGNLEYWVPYLRVGLELIVVDNGSTDGTPALLSQLREDYPEVKTILLGENRGVAVGRNAGWERATRPYILNLDDDAHLSSSVLSALLSRLDAASGTVGVIFPRPVHSSSGRPQVGHSLMEPANFHGCCHLVSRSALDEVGLLDPLCEFGGEELDLSIRMRDAGFRVLFAPDLLVQHNSLTRPGSEGLRRRRLWLRNYLRVINRYFPPGMALTFSLRLFTRHQLSALRSVGLRSLALLPSCLHGIYEGVRSRRPVSSSTAKFYRSRDLRPDCGNVPLLSSLRRRLPRTLGRRV